MLNKMVYTLKACTDILDYGALLHGWHGVMEHALPCAQLHVSSNLAPWPFKFSLLGWTAVGRALLATTTLEAVFFPCPSGRKRSFVDGVQCGVLT